MHFSYVSLTSPHLPFLHRATYNATEAHPHKKSKDEQKKAEEARRKEELERKKKEIEDERESLINSSSLVLLLHLFIK